MTDYEVEMPDTKGKRYVYGVDHFEIEEDGVLVFYETRGPHSGDSISLGEVANSHKQAVRAFSEWVAVEES